MRDHINTAFLIALIALAGLLAASCGGSKDVAVSVNAENANMPTVVDLTTEQAIVREMPTYFEATGNLASDAQTDVAPAVGGKIVAVNFDVGSYVTRGSVLVRLDDRDARIRLEQAQAQVQQQREAVRQAEANVRQAEANVRQTQARLGLTEGSNFDIETFSQVRAIQAQLRLAEDQLRRNERLLESGDVSRATVDQLRAQRDQLRAQLDEARSTASVAVASIRTAQAGVGTAQQAVNAARAAVQTAETQVSAAQKAIADAVVYAPISGYVAERSADLGEFASTQQKIATIVRTSTLRLRIDVPEQSIGQVQMGQGISLQVSAYPDRNFSGTVARILPNINATSRTLIVEAEVDNSGGLLKPGQFATVRITQPKATLAVMVPVRAIRTEGDVNRIFVIKDGRAEERLVQIGQLENDYIEIKQGVAEQESVATSNLNVLYDGVVVRQ
jgi:RND family efflux transporter MFP subunit